MVYSRNRIFFSSVMDVERVEGGVEVDEEGEEKVLVVKIRCDCCRGGRKAVVRFDRRENRKGTRVAIVFILQRLCVVKA